MDDLGGASLVGRTLAHYQISSIIGAGGMGEVYRATDTKLARDIALKVLPLEMASDPDRLARFQREARAVATLNHPNVVTVYSVEESDKVHFITMELIEGQPLDRLISANGLPTNRIIEIASAVAEALAAAHEKGIVHRDLKPANVMVTNEGRVKVLDFGLAKDVGAETANDATLTSAGRTQAGMVMGTPAYMSPEQVSGRPLDHRSDIFSFGVVLHEMATGRRPFEGSSSAELISSILRDAPPSVTDARPELPSDLARVVRRCLEKDPRHRVQTARDVSNEFRDLARTVSLSTPPPSSATRVASLPDSGTTRADEGFWVAVLPFRYMGSSADLKALAEGLSEEVITGLSRFSYLRVIARGSTAKYSSESGDVGAIGKEVGARYVMEGSVRQAGAQLRVTVQLGDAASGVRLWTETYQRPFDPEAVFNLQDDLVPRIVSTVADWYGVLPHTMSLAVRSKDPALLTPYEALLRSFSYAERVTAEEQVAAKAALQRAVEQSPNSSDCWAMLSILQTDGNIHGLDPAPDSLDDALQSAQRAVDIAPTNHKAYQALAWVRYFRKEFQPSQKAAERAIALNPMDGGALVYVGQTIAFAGDWDRGCSLVLRATELNPNHAGWYWYTPFLNAYRKNDYRAALDFALKINMPGFPLACIALAAAHGQLGETGAAQRALRELLTLRPNYASLARAELRKIWDDQLVEHLIEGLRKAGLEIPEAGAILSHEVSTSAAGTREKRDSGATRADEGFWVAVLPFRYSGNIADLKALAEGLSEEVITGLSRFTYLRVIARGSTARYSSESGDVRAIGKELGARYVMEGSLRQAGSKLRLAVQLVEATTGAHLWAENFERSLNPGAVFELQDDLVPRIVSTVADINGVLPRSMSGTLCNRPPEQLDPYEAVLRSFGYFERVTPEEMNAAIAGIESALQKAPTYADAWAMLALLSAQRYAQGFGLAADSLATGAAAARKAVEAAPANHLAWFSLAQVLFFQKEFRTFRNATERALMLNPMDSNSLALNGEMLALSGEWERGVSLAARARQLNPHHPGWYWHSDFNHAYRQRDYREALEIASKMNQTSNWGAWALTAAACGQLGDRDGAAKAIRELLKLRPDAVSRLREDCDKWFDAEHAAHIMEGFRKAGLEVDAAVSEGLSAAPRVASASSRANSADEGFWVAVLPFKFRGSNPDLAALADGLTDEVITGMSRFSYLRLIARSSTARYAREAIDVRTAANELGARYVMEGSIRQAGNKLRVAVQLVDAATGAHVWAETFERAFRPEEIFEFQDELGPRIVSTIADQHGILPRCICAAIRKKSDEQLSPYEAVFRVFGLHEKMTAQEHAACRDLLERVVRDAPEAADCWAMLATLYSDEDWFGLNLRPDPLGRAAAAAQRAAELAPASVLAFQALAQSLFMRHEWQAFRPMAERTIALNPMDGATVALMGILLACSGHWERGCAVTDSAMKLHPNFPGWYWLATVFNAYRTRDYRAAIDAAIHIQMPGYSWTSITCAAAYGQLSERSRAQKSLRELLNARPNFATTARQELEKWFEAELVEHFLEGLRKAGLENPPDQGAASAQAESK